MPAAGCVNSPGQAYGRRHHPDRGQARSVGRQGSGTLRHPPGGSRTPL